MFTTDKAMRYSFPRSVPACVPSTNHTRMPMARARIFSLEVAKGHPVCHGQVAVVHSRRRRSRSDLPSRCPRRDLRCARRRSCHGLGNHDREGVCFLRDSHAARWRVPKRLERPSLSDSGSESTRPPRRVVPDRITAPSWSGVPGRKRFRERRSQETAERERDPILDERLSAIPALDHDQGVPVRRAESDVMRLADDIGDRLPGVVAGEPGEEGRPAWNAASARRVRGPARRAR